MAKEGEAIRGGPGLVEVWQEVYQNVARTFFDAQEEFGRACKTLVDQGTALQSEGVKITRQSVDAGNAVYESLVKATGENIKRTTDVMTTLWVSPCRRQMEQLNKILFGG